MNRCHRLRILQPDCGAGVSPASAAPETAAPRVPSIQLKLRQVLVHLVLLRLTGQMNAEALEDAEGILSEQPDHLLGLAMAGDASLAMGDSASARAFYARWLDAFEGESQKDLLEYRDHAPMFPEMQATAEALGRND